MNLHLSKNQKVRALVRRDFWRIGTRIEINTASRWYSGQTSSINNVTLMIITEEQSIASFYKVKGWITIQAVQVQIQWQTSPQDPKSW